MLIFSPANTFLLKCTIQRSFISIFFCGKQPLVWVSAVIHVQLDCNANCQQLPKRSILLNWIFNHLPSPKIMNWSWPANWAEYLKKQILYRMKMYMEINLATWFRFVSITELNINEFWFSSFNDISYHWEISKNVVIKRILNLANLPSAK